MLSLMELSSMWSIQRCEPLCNESFEPTPLRGAAQFGRYTGQLPGARAKT